ncbi:peptidoglycan-binding domain-containing protein [Pontivivens insulae]|uniref:Peptidoglycan binding-like domain-containing protein n=1 Tax=Pontivivens insulae TaxID=1639689 RepID=A0A2R8AFM8_9RHOB|nr:peptidoglycan-binding protein [Pontivivens insulae]RED12287.1 putative peptidoglycan binding protein [Pontivivens insulae]SPF31044.1 hypothetical protein POI8812_03394 [Pontivivens insulae]
MFRIFRLALLASTVSAAPLMADPLALVITNSDYANGPQATVPDHADLVRAYEEAGFTVEGGQDLTRAEMFTLLTSFQRDVADAERLVIHLSGHTATAGGETWFLPVDARDDSVVRLAFTMPTVDLFLDMAAEQEGRSVVFLGTATDAGLEGDGFEPGLGRVYVPTGALMVSGPAQAVADIATDRALSEGASFRSFVSDLPDDISRLGFASPDATLVPLREDLPDDLGEAPAEPQSEPEPDEQQVDPAEATEQALELDRDDRVAIQENLVVLGYNTRGIDGIFGPGTRGAISAWQGEQDFEGTSFLTAGQLRLLGLQADNRRAEIAAEQERLRQQREAEDRAFWQSSGSDGSEEGLRVYLRNYPNGLFAAEAQTQLDAIEAEQRALASAEVQAAWQSAMETNTIEGYEQFLAQYPDSEFATTARARIDQINEQENRVDANLQAQEDALGLNTANRLLVQVRLASLGYAIPSVNGRFDAATREAIAQFQREYGQEPTGYLNQTTVRQLITLAPAE